MGRFVVDDSPPVTVVDGADTGAESRAGLMPPVASNFYTTLFVQPREAAEFDLIAGGSIISEQGDDGITVTGAIGDVCNGAPKFTHLEVRHPMASGPVERPTLPTQSPIAVRPPIQHLVADITSETPTVIVPAPESPLNFGEPVPSCVMNLRHAARIARILESVMEQGIADRVVVVMGTDTCEYIAAAVSAMIKDPSIPIVFTAAMNAVDEPFTDGPENYQKARVAARCLPKGVYVAVGDNVLHAGCVFKRSTHSHDAFQPVGSEPVAYFDQYGAFQSSYLSLEELYTRHKHYKWASQKLDGAEPGDHLECYVTHQFGPPALFQLTVNKFKDQILPPWQESGFVPELRELTDDEIGELLDYFVPGDQAGAKIVAENRLGIIEPYDSLDLFFQREARKETVVDTSFDEGVVPEYVSSGYNPQWLRSLLEREDVSSVILEGIPLCDEGTVASIRDIVAEFAGRKAVVIYEDGKLDHGNSRSLESVGGILSGNLSRAATWANTSVLMAQTGGTPSDLMDAWSGIHKSSGHGYKNAETPDNWMDLEPVVAAEGFRYVRLTPGYSPEVLESILADPSVEGVVLGVFGAGAVPYEGDGNLLPIIEKYAGTKPVLVKSMATEGDTDLDRYEEGQMLAATGAIGAAHLSLNELFQVLDQNRSEGSFVTAVSTVMDKHAADREDPFRTLGTESVRELAYSNQLALVHREDRREVREQPQHVNDVALNRKVSLFMVDLPIVVTARDSSDTYVFHLPAHKEVSSEEIEQLIGTDQFDIVQSEDTELSVFNELWEGVWHILDVDLFDNPLIPFTTVGDGTTEGFYAVKPDLLKLAPQHRIESFGRVREWVSKWLADE